MRRLLPRRLLVVTLSTLALAGCEPGTKLYPVKGTVTRQGQPVAGAVVTFHCEQPPKLATGTTDPAGAFQLNTFPEGRGALPGKQRVTVTKFSTPAAAPSASSMDDMVRKPGPQSVPRNELPAKYADPLHSGLEFTVTPGAANDFPIELND